MEWSLLTESAGRSHGFSPRTECRSYLRNQLFRRGFRNAGRLAEGLEIALQLLAIELWKNSAPRGDRRAWRSLLDRVAYQTMRELRPTAPRSLDSGACRAGRHGKSLGPPVSAAVLDG